MIEWYADLPWYARLGVSLVFFAAFAIVYFGFRRFSPLLVGAGIVFLMFAIPSRKKSKYEF